MLEIMLPYAKCVYTITPQNSRGLDGQLLAEEVDQVAESLGLEVRGQYCVDVREALDKARDYGIQNELPVLAFGSLSYLGQLKEELRCLTEKK